MTVRGHPPLRLQTLHRYGLWWSALSDCRQLRERLLAVLGTRPTRDPLPRCG